MGTDITRIMVEGMDPKVTVHLHTEATEHLTEVITPQVMEDTTRIARDTEVPLRWLRRPQVRRLWRLRRPQVWRLWRLRRPQVWWLWRIWRHKFGGYGGFGGHKFGGYGGHKSGGGYGDYESDSTASQEEH